MTAYGRRGAVLASLAFAGTGGVSGRGLAAEPRCPETFVAPGVGNVSLVPTGWGVNAEVAKMSVLEDTIVAPMGSRSYFASYCTPGEYSNEQYQAWDLRGKTLVYTTDLSHAGCGCNAALYLVSMRQNKHKSECGDHYCDANNVCGESCTEIDIQEGNRFSWHSTLHGSTDHVGVGKGYGGGGPGWNGPRDWSPTDFGPGGRCIDTNAPFEVSVSFPTDGAGKLKAMDLFLSQEGSECPLSIYIGDYGRMAELETALAAGMTPIVSYWSSAEMLWMDGKGMDNQGPCAQDFPDRCEEAVRFYGFSVTPAFPPTTATTTEEPSTSASPRPPPAVPSAAPWSEYWNLAGHRAVDPPTLRAFLTGAASLLACQLLVLLVVWPLRALCRRQDAEMCASPPAPVLDAEAGDGSTLRRQRGVTGSQQCLLMLAAAGGAPVEPQSREISLMATNA